MMKNKKASNIKKIDLTEGKVLSSLLKVALPIMGASFLQMAYNLSDMFWIGFKGSGALAAVGIGGFFTWLSMAPIRLVAVGTEVKVAQRTGAQDEEGAFKYAKNGFELILVFSIVFASIIILFKNEAIGFFNIPQMDVRQMAREYLWIVMLGTPFVFFSSISTSVFNVRGNSGQAFKVNAVGLIFNMVLDPILILGLGPLPALGAAGAAIATVFSQAVVAGIFVFLIFIDGRLFDNFRIFVGRDSEDISIKKNIISMGSASALHTLFFTIIAMVIGRMVAGYGAAANAVQKLGTQFESISWMTANGIGSALSAFIGQNYGAGKMQRVREGYKSGIRIAIIIGVVANFILFFGAKLLMYAFIREPYSVSLGMNYLRILSISQIFMSIEITGTGVFNGLGSTRIPAFIGAGMNLLRIPASMILTTTALGLDGIWWSISVSSIFKGIIVYICLQHIMRKKLPPEKLAT